MLKIEVIEKIEENLKHADFKEVREIWYNVFPEEELSDLDYSKEHKVEILGIMFEELEFIEHEKLAYVYELATEESLSEDDIILKEDEIEDDDWDS